MKPFMTILIVISLTSSNCFAQSGKRSKNINFEDELIEGINRKPMDSFNQISEKNRNQKNHLYNKRAGFNDRQQALMSEMEFGQ